MPIEWILVCIIGAVLSFFLLSRWIRIVPQQDAWVVEQLGRYKYTMSAGMHFLIPFVQRVAYKHSLKEIPLDVPSQICITRDNTQLQVDGVLYFQVVDAKMASYGSQDYVMAISQLAQTTLRSAIGKMELDRTFEERDSINMAVVQALDEAAVNWGVKVLRYEIKDLTPPREILQAMQQQITAEREKRARIAQSEGVQQEQINLATGSREAAIRQSQGDMEAAINRAKGDAEAIRLAASANAEAIRLVANSLCDSGGIEALNMKIAEQYIHAFSNLAKETNTMLLPSNAADLAGFVATATSVIKKTNQA